MTVGEDLEELNSAQIRALKSMGPIFHYMGKWKEGYQNRLPVNGLFFGDIWTIPGTKQYVVYLGEHDFKRIPIEEDTQ